MCDPSAQVKLRRPNGRMWIPLMTRRQMIRKCISYISKWHRNCTTKFCRISPQNGHCLLGLEFLSQDIEKVLGKDPPDLVGRRNELQSLSSCHWSDPRVIFRRPKLTGHLQRKRHRILTCLYTTLSNFVSGTSVFTQSRVKTVKGRNI